jgi:hypothetical protein
VDDYIDVPDSIIPLLIMLIKNSVFKRINNSVPYNEADFQNTIKGIGQSFGMAMSLEEITSKSKALT